MGSKRKSADISKSIGMIFDEMGSPKLYRKYKDFDRLDVLLKPEQSRSSLLVKLQHSPNVGVTDNSAHNELQIDEHLMRQLGFRNTTKHGYNSKAACYFDVDLDIIASSSAASASNSLSVSQFLTLCIISSRLRPPSRISFRLCDVIPLR